MTTSIYSDDGWYVVTDSDEWWELCPEAEEEPEAYPAAVQIIQVGDDGFIFSTIDKNMAATIFSRQVLDGVFEN